MLRFLDLLRQELRADDARAELGGRDPDDPRLIWTSLGNGWRLVLSFNKAPDDRVRVCAQLKELVAGFSQSSGDRALPPAPDPPVDSAFRRLDTALEGLRARSGAIGVVLIDDQSPVLWGHANSHRGVQDVEAQVDIGRAVGNMRRAGLTLDELFALAPADLSTRLTALGVEDHAAELLGEVIDDGEETPTRHFLLTCLAVARARQEAETKPRPARWAFHETQFGYLVRSFANIYLLISVFEGAFSELHVESAVVHALPAIEQLLVALPPLDPPPRAGRVIRLRR
jgi:hypothetical protein